MSRLTSGGNMRLPQPVDDGLIIPAVGSWSREKHHFLLRYVDAFTNAMKDKRWSGLHYIDLFAGAGIERVEDTGAIEWGSPLIAAQAGYPFKRLHLCELDRLKFAALCARVNVIRGSADQILNGDANEMIAEIVTSIPARSLSLAFLDPYGLHLAYSTLERLSRIRADLIIFFPDRLDANRNWEAYYRDNPDSNLDSVLGPGSNWREEIGTARQQRRLDKFRELYVRQIRKLGYKFFEREPIPNKGAPLYSLIFCSKEEVALKIWRGISLIKPGGQRTLGFE